MTERPFFVSATWVALAAVAALAVASLVEPLIAAAGGSFLPVMTARSCAQVGAHGGLAGVATFGFAALGVAVLLRGVTALARLARAGRATARLAADPVALGDERVWVLPTRGLVAFSAGWLRPRTFVSAGALGDLGAAELSAVLAHERRHRLRRDPLRRGLRHALCECFFFLPGLRRLSREDDEAAEAAADAAALRESDGPRPLAAALLRFDGAAGCAVSARRVDRLCGMGGGRSRADGGVLAAACAAVGLLAFALLVVAVDPGRPLHLCATETTLLVGITWAGARRRGAGSSAPAPRGVPAT
jgi:hypothetical protein